LNLGSGFKRTRDFWSSSIVKGILELGQQELLTAEGAENCRRVREEIQSGALLEFAKRLTGAESARFSQALHKLEFRGSWLNSSLNHAKSLIPAGFIKIDTGGCTIFGHGLVDDLHSIENTSTYGV
jgi:hypothetical protein